MFAGVFAPNSIHSREFYIWALYTVYSEFNRTGTQGLFTRPNDAVAEQTELFISSPRGCFDFLSFSFLHLRSGL